MNTQNQQVNPAAIMDMSTAYWRSQVLLTANRLGVFECLAEGPQSLEAVCNALGTHPRATRLLLKACEALELVVEAPDGFVNGLAAAAFLVPNKPGYLGNAIRYSDNLYGTWGKLEQALKTGEPQLAPEAYLGGDSGITRDFVYGMHDRALGIGRVLVELVDLTQCRQLLDVGGGPGTYASLFAQRVPTLKATVLDLPGVIAHAKDIIAGLGVADRVTTLAGSYFDASFPPGNDAVLISGVLHRESQANCRALIKKAAASLDPGGLLVLSDVFTDAGGASPVFATLFGVNMMLTAPEGGVHSDADVGEWLTDAGFRSVKILPFPPPLPHRVVMGKR